LGRRAFPGISDREIIMKAVRNVEGGRPPEIVDLPTPTNPNRPIKQTSDAPAGMSA
jgi:hypothetical protein